MSDTTQWIIGMLLGILFDVPIIYYLTKKGIL